MTLTQYKKVIQSLTRDEIETHLFGMFKSSKGFKDIESSYWSEESNAERIASLKKRLEKVFWKEPFSLGECKTVLNDYLNRTVDEGTKAWMHLIFAIEAAELSATYGDFGKRFYDSLESAAKKYLDYAKLHPEFFRLHETEFERVISITEPLGYGVSADLEYMVESVRVELGYYEGTNEDK